MIVRSLHEYKDELNWCKIRKSNYASWSCGVSPREAFSSLTSLTSLGSWSHYLPNSDSRRICLLTLLTCSSCRAFLQVPLGKLLIPRNSPSQKPNSRLKWAPTPLYLPHLFLTESIFSISNQFSADSGVISRSIPASIQVVYLFGLNFLPISTRFTTNLDVNSLPIWTSIHFLFGRHLLPIWTSILYSFGRAF
jgi:hypothetical protein